MYPDLEALKLKMEIALQAVKVLSLPLHERTVVDTALKAVEEYWGAKYSDCVDRT